MSYSNNLDNMARKSQPLWSRFYICVEKDIFIVLEVPELVLLLLLQLPPKVPDWDR